MYLKSFYLRSWLDIRFVCDKANKKQQHKIDTSVGIMCKQIRQPCERTYFTSKEAVAREWPVLQSFSFVVAGKYYWEPYFVVRMCHTILFCEPVQATWYPTRDSSMYSPCVRILRSCNVMCSAEHYIFIDDELSIENHIFRLRIQTQKISLTESLDVAKLTPDRNHIIDDYKSWHGWKKIISSV
jgi:hypothetical protein